MSAIPINPIQNNRATTGTGSGSLSSTSKVVVVRGPRARARDFMRVPRLEVFNGEAATAHTVSVYLVEGATETLIAKSGSVAAGGRYVWSNDPNANSAELPPLSAGQSYAAALAASATVQPVFKTEFVQTARGSL